MSKNTENTLAEETVSTIDDRRRFYAERLRTEIPANWDIQNVGDLCSIRTGKLDVNQADEGGKYPFFTCAEKIYRINTHAFDAEAVLVAGNGFFNVKYYKGKFNAYQRTYVLSDIKTHAKFLYYYIDYRLRDITGESRGSTISYIRLGDLRDYPVAVAPPDQQKNIVGEIEKQFSRLDEAVANLKRVKANLKRYKASVLKAAVEGKLTEDWRKQHPNVESASKFLELILAERREKWCGKGKYEEPSAPEITALSSLPKGWMWALVEQLSLLVQ
ncbi:MAG TPA: restriction endonuclease subunit S [Nitrospiraceae bacterium]|nr:restriction endonuclease subunit S [Nitrospiraceae bacterium]